MRKSRIVKIASLALAGMLVLFAQSCQSVQVQRNGNKGSQTIHQNPVISPNTAIGEGSASAQQSAASAASVEGLFLYGWSTWGGLEASTTGTSVVILNGAVQAGGYVCANIDKSLAGKTIDLAIDKGASAFSEHRLMKITANQNDELIKPSDVPTLLFGEYVPDTRSRIEFTIPADFDGKLGFVFYQANLQGLRITASIK
jgi:hypothetical protein